MTLSPAFDAADRPALLRQIAEEEPQAPRQRNRAIPVDLETIVLKALTKEPQRRYATAKELADDLGRFLEHRPITARRPTVAERVSKWVRRHRSIVSTAALLLVLLGVLVARERHVAYTELSKAFPGQGKGASRPKLRPALRLMPSGTEPSRHSSGLAWRWTSSPRPATRRWPIGPEPAKVAAHAVGPRALNYYLEFIDQVGDDPALQLQLAESQMRAAGIMDKIGSPEEVQTALDQARQIQEKLLRSQPLSLMVGRAG